MTIRHTGTAVAVTLHPISYVPLLTLKCDDKADTFLAQRRLRSRTVAPHPLEPFTNSTGLYATCPWSDSRVRQLILRKKLAPRYTGTDDKLDRTEKCPICFLFYRGGLNRSDCCDKPICTECFLQLKPPNGNVDCPYCNNLNFVAEWEPFNGEKQILEDIEESKTIAAKILVVVTVHVCCVNYTCAARVSLGSYVLRATQRACFNHRIIMQTFRRELYMCIEIFV